MVNPEGLLGQGAGILRLDLARRAQIDDRPHAQDVAHLSDIFGCHVLWCVASKQPTPAQATAVADRVAAQIAEVVTAPQCDDPLGSSLLVHLDLLSVVAARSSLVGCTPEDTR